MSDASDPWAPRPQRVAVFRALQLGDMLCAVPALRALRAFLPEARITLVGLPWARAFVERFAAYLDDFIAMPGYPGNPELDGSLDGFLDALLAARDKHFDLAIQMHGSGEMSNRITGLLGARRVAGFAPSAALHIPFPHAQPEIHRYLTLMAFLGVPLQGDHLEFPLAQRDWTDYQVLAQTHSLRASQFVVVHPGSQLRSRRWPVERFAAVARQLAREGHQVVITGTPQEAKLTAAITQTCPAAIDLAGKTTLGSLGALIAQAALVVCNDTGLSHVAAALGTRSVVLALGSDVKRWAPLDSERHHVIWRDMPCRPCAYNECPVGHGCATAILPDAVLVAARRQLQMGHRHAA